MFRATARLVAAMLDVSYHSISISPPEAGRVVAGRWPRMPSKTDSAVRSGHRGPGAKAAPTVVISFLRGINVGGRHPVRMDELRALYSSLGLEDAQTYLQSGNVLFRAGQRDLQRLGTRIESQFERRFGFRVAVILRTLSELRDAAARNPFAQRPQIEPGKLICVFLAGEPDRAARERIGVMNLGEDELAFHQHELYMYCPGGLGRSKLWPAIDRALNHSSTARNWNTVTQLVAAGEAMERSLSAHAT